MNRQITARSTLQTVTAVSCVVWSLGSQAADEPTSGVLQEVVVTGSQIRGASVDALPVSVISADDIKATGIVSGDDLYRSIPQVGDINFNTQNLRASSAGFARGDVASVNLRDLGAGNTLVLLNGRRIVKHPTAQGNADFTYNANTIPVGGIERVEVLLDGAAAIYGSDAVAGVVNNVLRSNFEGFNVDAQYGGAGGTNFRQMQLTGLWGVPFASGRGNVTTYLGFAHDTPLYASDQAFTQSDDRRPMIENTSFAGNLSFDSRDQSSPWGAFRAPASAGTVRSNGIALTNSSGQFHIQPATQAGCQLNLANGLCIDDGVITGAADRNLRSDLQRAIPGLTVNPEVKRANFFSFINFEISDQLAFFGELGYYQAKTEATTLTLAPLVSVPITIPASNYYNPFGAITSPNRLPGLNIPDAGVPLTILNYRIADTPDRTVAVDNSQFRILSGLRGEIGSWDWESAALYSGASVKDSERNSVSNTLFQAALARSTPDAYNPFNGGDLNDPSLGDPTPSLDVTSFLISSKRKTESTLALWDLKFSKADLFALPAGNFSMAFGAEVRRETVDDDRASGLDTTTTFTDSVTGLFYESDTLGASPAYDLKNDRNVYSAYLELAVPVVSAEMKVPLVRSLEFQLAGRYENYSDVGDVAKPKIAGAWTIVNGVRFRSAWSQAFKAPTLEQLAPVDRPSVSGRLDDVKCEADLRAGRIATWSACGQRTNMLRVNQGNPNLKPEESESFSYGVVLDALFIPPQYGELTLTIDHWKIEQEGRISFISAENDLTIDYLRRVQGSSNPAVVRDTPTAADIAAVAGTGLAPIGAVLGIYDQYENFDLRKVEGIDFGVAYDLKETRFGNFSLDLNLAKTLEYSQEPSPAQKELLAAQAAGLINAGTAVGGSVDFLETSPVYPEAGQPKWRGSSRVAWSNENWGAGASANYVGKVYQRTVVNAAGEQWEIDPFLTVNLYGEFRFNRGFVGDDANTSVRLGVRNVGDKDPPLGLFGYVGSLHQPWGRFWYLNLHTSF
jgi:iron complex outermembrane recepter protein